MRCRGATTICTRASTGLKTNLFLAPGEGDYVPEDPNGARNGGREAGEPDALRVVRGEVR